MRCRRALIVLLFALLWCAAPARAAIITFDSMIASENGEFTLDIRVADVSDLFTFGFDLTFDPTVIQLTTIVEGSFLSGPDASRDTIFFEGDTSTVGRRSLFGTLFEGVGESGSGILATITFQSLSAGNAALDFANVLFFDSASPQGNEIPVEALPGVITVGDVAGVPEPSTLLLTGLGLAALGRRRLRA